jgi:uncharacterized membrane protein YidH (DUF202 family)
LNVRHLTILYTYIHSFIRFYSPVFEGMFKNRTSSERVGSESEPATAPSSTDTSSSSVGKRGSRKSMLIGDGHTLHKMSKRMSTSVMAFTELFDDLPEGMLDDISDSEFDAGTKPRKKEEAAPVKQSNNITASKVAPALAVAAVATTAAVAAKPPAPAPTASATRAAASSTTAPPTASATASSSNGGAAGGGGGGGLGFFAIFRRDGENETGRRKPARVEPKSFFANERTFIQWISAALLLVTISVILLDFQSASGVPATAGIVLNSVAVFIVFYSIYAYYRRLVLLQSASAYGYVDHFGPIVLAMAVLLGVLMLLYYYIESGRAPPDTTVYTGPVLTQNTAGGCSQQALTGAPSLSFQPSGIAVDLTRNQLLIPSLDTVTGLSYLSPATPVTTLVKIPNTDLEAITRVVEGDTERWFTLSEGEKFPMLYELGWNATGLGMSVLNEWELNTGESPFSGLAEGLAHVPDPEVASGRGSFYVAGDINDPLFPANRGVVNIFDVPPADGSGPETLERTGSLNSNLINSNLKDSKIGELDFFENVLYILNDNSRVIRAWDVGSGQLLATTFLPRVGEGFDLQWEGMKILRPAASTNLRGASTPLNVLLALDTPPQVWLFNATTGAVPGSIVFPECAAAVA